MTKTTWAAIMVLVLLSAGSCSQGNQSPLWSDLEKIGAEDGAQRYQTQARAQRVLAQLEQQGEESTVNESKENDGMSGMVGGMIPARWSKGGIPRRSAGVM